MGDALHKVIVLIGPPGSGKGEQGERLSQVYGMSHISIGELVRSYCGGDDHADVCEEVEEKYRKGEPQDDSFIYDLLRGALATLPLENGIIFDAFPLAVSQLSFYKKLQTEFGLADPIVIYLAVNEDEAVRRLTSRTVSPGHSFSYETSEGLVHREDDREDVVRYRYKVYRERLDPLLVHYTEAGIPVIHIDNPGNPDEVFDEVRDNLNDYF